MQWFVAYFLFLTFSQSPSTISKSVFCSAFKELEHMNDVEYFPCYEIFLRHNQKKINKYRKDQLHVSNKFINKILLKYFKRSFF